MYLEKFQKDADCKLGLNPLNQIVLALAHRSETEIEGAKEYVKRCKIKKFQSVTSKKLKKEDFEALNLLNKINAEFNREKINRSKLYKIYKEVENSNGIFHLLIRLAIANLVNNKGWLRKEAQRGLSLDFEQIIFLTPYLIDANNKNLFYESLILLLKKLSDIDDFLVKLFLYHYTSMHESNDKIQSIRSKLELNWSLNQIRSLRKSVNYGKKYRGFWLRITNKRSSDLEFDHFLNEINEENSIKNLNESELWVLKWKFPFKDPEKSLAIERLVSLWNSEESYYKYLVLEFVEDKMIRGLMSKKIEEFKIPYFQFKKNLLRELSNKDGGKAFILYQMILLGDYQNNILNEL